jgi:hypothetical protein
VEANLTKSEVLEHQAQFSGRLSDLVRAVGFGLVLMGALGPGEPILALLGALTLVLDGAQSLLGYWMARAALAAGEPYSYRHGRAPLFFGLKSLAFYGKQFVALLGVVLFVWP